ncbi:MAG: GtrA family protein [Lachnospiraceae bacterium]|nr:GtrA family protein [Lachnospiraceae bacterium]
MSKIKELFTKYKEMIMYLFFGVGTTAVNWIIYTIMVTVAGIGNLTLANVVAWIGAVAFAYITNKLWVFESKSWNPNVVLKELGMFLGARIVSGIFEIGLFPVLVWMGLNQAIFGIEGMVAKVIISVLVIVLNYIFSKLLVFKKEK